MNHSKLSSLAVIALVSLGITSAHAMDLTLNRNVEVMFDIPLLPATGASGHFDGDQLFSLGTLLNDGRQASCFIRLNNYRVSGKQHIAAGTLYSTLWITGYSGGGFDVGLKKTGGGKTEERSVSIMCWTQHQDMNVNLFKKFMAERGLNFTDIPTQADADSKPLE